MFDSPQYSGPSGPQSRLANAFVWAGAGLFIAGALLAGPALAPYVASRLYVLPPVQALEPSLDGVAPTVRAPEDSLPGQQSSLSLLPLFGPDDEIVHVAPTPIPPTPEATPTISSPETPTPFLRTPIRTPIPIPAPAGQSPVRIVIASIGVDATVVETDWEMVDVGGVEYPVWIVPEAHLAGWHANSAALGVRGNTVINAHNWPQNAVFRDLYMIEPGDQIYVYSASKPFVYEVSEILLLPEAGQPLEVRQANARYIQPTDDERVTLVTCHPYGQVTYRLVVIARPVVPARPIVEEP